MAELGVATNVHYKPLPMFTAYKKLGFDIQDYPNAFNIYKNEITLPLHTSLSNEDVEYICEKFKYVIDEAISGIITEEQVGWNSVIKKMGRPAWYNEKWQRKKILRHFKKQAKKPDF